MTAAIATARADLDVARAVLATEASGLRALAAGLDEAFTQAVETLVRVTGRVVVSGMGKSGHVARKIAATLASTGTPALFVHPAEASHGDLGMIVAGDALLALSNSGETPELADLVRHARRLALPLVAVTGDARSALARAADVGLLLPAAAEACPMGLAPTTSTVMQMALGDALAVALLTRRGFTAADFRRFHPGGRLGARLRRVRELMHAGEEMPLAPPDLPMDAALLRMTEKRFGCLGVTDAAGRLEGIMTRDPQTIAPDALAAEALHAMNARKRPITALFVVDPAGRPVGILHIHDLLRAGVA